MTLDRCRLNQDDLDELLMGVARPELRAHCADCVRCRGRVAAFAASMQPFNRASLAWSEARSHTFSRDLSGHRPAWRLSSSNLRSAAAMLILGLLASLALGMHPRLAIFADGGPEPVPRALVADARAQQIARDNAMLQAIDAELTEPDSAPAGLFHAEDRLDAQPAAGQDRD